MIPVPGEKLREISLLISPKDLKWFQTNFPKLNFQADETTVSWNEHNKKETKLVRKAFEDYRKKHSKASSAFENE